MFQCSVCTEPIKIRLQCLPLNLRRILNQSIRTDNSTRRTLHTKILKESIIATKGLGVGKTEGVSGHLPHEHNERYYKRGQIDVNHNVP